MTAFKIKASTLGQAISSAISVVPTSQKARDILKCFKIKAFRESDQDRLSLQTSDLEMFLSIEITDNDLMVETAGEFVVPALPFYEFIKSVIADSLSVKVEENGVIQLSATDTSFEIGSQDLDEFPPFSLSQEGTTVKIAIDEFKEALDKVAFAVADKNHPKFNFTAVCLVLDSTTLSVMGGDSHRASLAVTPLVGPTTPIQILVNPKPLEQIVKTFSGEIELTVGKYHLAARSGSSFLSTQGLNGEFPPIKNILPQHPTSITLNAKEFLSYVKKALLATDSRNTLRILIKKDMMCLSTKTQEQRKSAKVNYTLPYNGPEFEFSIDGKYLTDVLKVVNGEIMLYFNENGGPLLFTQEKFDHLMAPMEV
jgi:DNA polymerase III subunit beta